MVEDKSAYVSQGKRKIWRKKYTSVRKTSDVLLYGGILPKNNSMFHIDTIKVISLMQHLKEKLQLKAGRLHNVTIACHTFKKYTCVRMKWEVYTEFV